MFKILSPQIELIEERVFGPDPWEKAKNLKLQGLITNWEEIFPKIVGLVLKVIVDTETPFIKLLEQQPTTLSIDKCARRVYLLSGSLDNFKRFCREYKEQKLTKALLNFLYKRYKNIFKDLWPKHGLICPVGFSFKELWPEDLDSFELSIKIRHYYVLVKFCIAEKDLLDLYAWGLSPCILKKEPKIWIFSGKVPPAAQEVGEKYLEFVQALPRDLQEGFFPRAIAFKGFLFAPLLSFMGLFSRVLSQEAHSLKAAVHTLLLSFKENFGEPFTLLD